MFLFNLFNTFFNYWCMLLATQTQPFFKLLSMLVEFVGGPPGMPLFLQHILVKFWEVSMIMIIVCSFVNFPNWISLLHYNDLLLKKFDFIHRMPSPGGRILSTTSTGVVVNTGDEEQNGHDLGPSNHGCLGWNVSHVLQQRQSQKLLVTLPTHCSSVMIGMTLMSMTTKWEINCNEEAFRWCSIFFYSKVLHICLWLWYPATHSDKHSKQTGACSPHTRNPLLWVVHLARESFHTSTVQLCCITSTLLVVLQLNVDWVKIHCFLTCYLQDEWGGCWGCARSVRTSPEAALQSSPICR